jgi:ribonuclease
MRRFSWVRWVLLAVVLGAAPASAQLSNDVQGLAILAQRAGLQDVAGFIETVQSLRGSGRLLARYVTKDEAKAHGWRGGGLCAVWPGHVIGGDVFHNFGKALPAPPGRVYRESDLDATCRERGPKRLIFSNDGAIFLTVDHYNSFTPVP